MCILNEFSNILITHIMEEIDIDCTVLYAWPIKRKRKGEPCFLSSKISKKNAPNQVFLDSL